MPSKYSVVLADPSWPYNDGQKLRPETYDRMRLRDIRALAVEPILEENATLFMWATGPLLEAAFPVIRAWGFRYVTIAFGWVKANLDGTPKMGMGWYTRANLEICLLGVRGSLDRQSKAVRQIIETEAGPETFKSIPGDHSEKPAAVRDRIVDLCGDVPRIELFARQRVPGWDAIGNDLLTPETLQCGLTRRSRQISKP